MILEKFFNKTTKKKGEFWAKLYVKCGLGEPTEKFKKKLKKQVDSVPDK
jgi:hypothetical protein